MASIYASVAPQFTRELLSPGLRVGYTDDGGVWQFVAPSLCQRLPLRAIEWRNLVGVTKRIDQLPVHFVEISLGNVQRELLPHTCIYVVKCEDLDTYKSVVRPPLAAWADAMTANRVEWLVLYVPLGTRPKAAGNAPNAVYKKVFDRLKADFTHKRSGPLSGPASSLQERVCKIDTLEGTSVLGQQQQHESQWTELMLRLRHCVMDAFQTKCFQYEERLRVLDAKRGAAGWDFGAFFLAKERLALMYQQMYLQDDAIRHLDELDAIFMNLNETEMQTFRDGSKHSFSTQDLIFTRSPLALDLNETQRYIASNRASARLISLYCFCRQIRTLYVMGSFPQLLKRASSFIESFLTELKEMTDEGALDWHQPYLWAVGACLEVAYACELSWSGRDEEWTASSVSVQVAQAIPVEEMSRALGNVLYLARRMLKHFARSNRSRSELRVSFSNTSHNGDVESEVLLAWYQQLEQVFVAPEWQQSESCELYEHCLSEVSHLASMHFSQSGRHRFAVFLGGECARYHLARGEFESASRLLRSLARQSEEDGWWTIFGACVRSICRAELALGRSTQAVAACFSMLQLAQEEQVGVSKEEMEQLMLALVRSLENNRPKSDSIEEAEKDNNSDNTAAKVNMGELFRPTVTVETTQTSGDVLEHGDIRVTLGITNDFPAGVQLEKVRVRFSKTPMAKQQKSEEPISSLSSPHSASLRKDTSTLDNLVLDEDALPGVPAEHDSETTSAESPPRNENSQLLPSSSKEITELMDEVINFCEDTHEPPDQETEVLLEESGVHLDEKTGVNLVFIHSGVLVGHYTCTNVECVLAGNTFRLLPPSALALASFEIGVKESTVQVAIDGAPLLMPRPSTQVETIVVFIQANDDMMLNGTAELRIFKRSSKGNHVTHGDGEELEGEEVSDVEEECDVQFIGAKLSEESGSECIERVQDEANHNADSCSSTLTIALPPLTRGGSLSYVVSLLVPPIDRSDHTCKPEAPNEDAASVTIRASVRYQRETTKPSTRTTTTEIRCTQSTFQVLQPLVETVRLKRVGARVFASFALTCNPFIPVTLLDYQFLCPGSTSVGSDPALTVEQDPNTKLRGTTLRPRGRLHLVFTLICSPNFEKEVSGDSCSLQLHLSYGNAGSWQKTMTVQVPLDEIQGNRYRVDVLPRGYGVTDKFTGEMVETSASEPVTFQIHVQEEVSQSNQAALENETNTLSLCLNETSERDWILVGKQLERFKFDPCSGGNGDRRREFSTQKRLLATRAGQLRFPNFRLEINGLAIPAARVHCQQSSRRVLAS